MKNVKLGEKNVNENITLYLATTYEKLLYL